MSINEELPPRKERLTRGGPSVCSISVDVKVVTPILGGGAQTRELDEVDVIRPATVRGHLRFWWRALFGGRYASTQDLYEAESNLWGKAAGDEGGRSPVELRIEVNKIGEMDDSPISLFGKNATPGAYALWPAREEKKSNLPTAPRRKPGTQFTLTLRGPVDRKTDLRNVLRAWLLFGGYGGRTRRGLGSFTVVGDATNWLPGGASKGGLDELFAYDVFASNGTATSDVPLISGSALYVGKPDTADRAWVTALEWLREFRQGTTGGRGSRAREPGEGKIEPNRPSISNWPEADKIRHLKGKTTTHPPRHSNKPAWPRAGFGLPIVGQFQKNARGGGFLDEPGGFELCWARNNELHDRLASPLILKAIPLANGEYAPTALWLHRAYPASGEVMLRGVQGSGAPFDQLLAPGDEAYFSALGAKKSGSSGNCVGDSDRT